MRKSRCKRNNSSRMEGGNLGAGYGFPVIGSSIPSFDKTINNPIIQDSITNCRAAIPTGFLTNGYTGPKGLPGMSGGKHRKSSRKQYRKSSRKQYRKSSRKQSGGRYGFDVQGGPPGGAPWATSYAPISSIPCEASRQPIPDSGAANSLNKVGGPLWDGPVPEKGVMLGGASPAPITWANNDATSGSPSLMVPTARYTDNAPNTPPIVSAAGTNIMIHKPLNYPEMNPACLKTGGSRKSSKKSRKSSKKHKKTSKRKY
jgi:hypothetical protein